jgi:hypothetical protein
MTKDAISEAIVARSASARSRRARTLMATGFVVAALASGCTVRRRSGDAELGSTKSALTADQCDYFQVGGKTRICHATGSAKSPYVILDLSESACVTAHAAHPADFVSLGGAPCNGRGCLPQGAPSDATIDCCEGLAPKNGICEPTDPCLGVACTVSDQCHVAACDPGTGLCVETSKVDGFPCDDGSACTTGDACHAGACSGAPVICAAADPCHVAGTCDAQTGLCSTPAARDGTTCNDGNACTQTDTCLAGSCTGSNPVVCVAFDQCHSLGQCDSSTGKCSNPNQSDGTACDDGQPCTRNDRCTAGVCSGSSFSCTPGDCQTGGTCNEDGTCSFGDAPDGSPCSFGTCLTGRCVVGSQGCAVDCAVNTPSTPNCLDGVCVQCRTSTDCLDASFPVCDASVHQCFRCKQNTDCTNHPGNPMCDALTGACVGCVVDADCATAAAHCVSNVCVAS